MCSVDIATCHETSINYARLILDDGVILSEEQPSIEKDFVYGTSPKLAATFGALTLAL